MKRRIFKYTLTLQEYQTLNLPRNAEIITFRSQLGKLTIWAIVNTELDYVPREFQIVGTGEDFVIANRKYIGTAEQGSFVWHLFEVIK
jgi:hypothetical protein